jgi:hypothetical protein
MGLAPRTPTQGHWDALKAYFQPAAPCSMELEEFLVHWDVSREDLATGCDCSLTTVSHWFSQGVALLRRYRWGRRKPGARHKQRMALAHHTWTAIETEPEYLQKLREVYVQRLKPKRQS